MVRCAGVAGVAVSVCGGQKQLGLTVRRNSSRRQRLSS